MLEITETLLDPSTAIHEISHELLKTVLEKGAKFVGHCFVDPNKLPKQSDVQDKAAKAANANDNDFLRKIGNGLFVFLFASFTGGSLVGGAVAAGVIIATAGFNWLFKSNEIERKKRWEEIVTSMVAKYRIILDNAAKKQWAKMMMEIGVAEIRKDNDFKLENADEEKFETIKVGNKEHKVTAGDLIRFRIYSSEILGWEIPMNPYSRERIAKASLLVRGYANLWSAHGSDARCDDRKIERQREVVRKMLDEGYDLYSSDMEELGLGQRKNSISFSFLHL